MKRLRLVPVRWWELDSIKVESIYLYRYEGSDIYRLQTYSPAGLADEVPYKGTEEEITNMVDSLITREGITVTKSGPVIRVHVA
jgi:hypothetical protein